MLKFKRKGSAVMETALVLPVILFLAYGGIEFGYYFFVKHTLQGAAREGARAAIVTGAANTDVTTAVANVMTSAGLGNSGYTITTSPSTILGTPAGTAVTVTVSVTWGNVGVRPLSLIPATKQVQGATVMRKEG